MPKRKHTLEGNFNFGNSNEKRVTRSSLKSASISPVVKHSRKISKSDQQVNQEMLINTVANKRRMTRSSAESAANISTVTVTPKLNKPKQQVTPKVPIDILLGTRRVTRSSSEYTIVDAGLKTVGNKDMQICDLSSKLKHNSKQSNLRSRNNLESLNVKKVITKKNSPHEINKNSYEEDYLTTALNKEQTRRHTVSACRFLKKSKITPKIRGKSVGNRRTNTTNNLKIADCTPKNKSSLASLFDHTSKPLIFSSPMVGRPTMDILSTYKPTDNSYFTTPKPMKRNLTTIINRKPASLPHLPGSQNVFPSISGIKKAKVEKKRKKNNSLPADSGRSLPAKGTLKRKRWMLNALKEKNDGYEDDIFESKKFDLVKATIQKVDDESDSSVSISTPKFDFILSPMLPRKTPRFKDCISTSELLQARKCAEEYLYRRNKKRRSGSKMEDSTLSNSASESKTESLTEKRKLEFAEAMSKLATVQNDLEKHTQDDSEEEDAYFSDVSV